MALACAALSWRPDRHWARCLQFTCFAGWGLHLHGHRMQRGKVQTRPKTSRKRRRLRKDLEWNRYRYSASRRRGFWSRDCWLRTLTWNTSATQDRFFIFFFRNRHSNFKLESKVREQITWWQCACARDRPLGMHFAIVHLTPTFPVAGGWKAVLWRFGTLSSAGGLAPRRHRSHGNKWHPYVQKWWKSKPILVGCVPVDEKYGT